MKKRLTGWISLAKMIYRQNWSYVFSTILACFGVFFLSPLITPIFLQQLFDQIESGTPSSLLRLVLATLLVLAIATAFAYVLLLYSEAWFCRLANHGSIHSFRSLYTIPFYQVGRRYSPQEQLNRIAHGCDGSTGVFAFSTNIITCLLSAGLVLVLLLRSSALFLVYAVLLASIEVIRTFVEGRRCFRIQKEIETHSAAAHGELFSLFTNLEELSVSSSQDFYIQKYRQARQAMWKEKQRKALLAATLDAVSETALLGTLWGLYSHLSVLIRTKAASLGILAAGQSLFQSFTGSLTRARSKAAMLPEAFAEIERLEEILEGSQPDYQEDSEPVPTSQPAVEIRNLCIEGKEGELFPNLSLSIQPGEKVAVVGPNGCGKSTLLRAIMGEYPLSSGQVLLYGEDVFQLPPQRKRRRIGFCPASFQLYGVTGEENIKMGTTAKEMTLFENGESRQEREKYLHSPANKLSEGQKQRVAIYRSLIGKAPLVIADEPDSALDPEQAERFLDCLIRESDTLIAITHNPAALSKFTRVIDMKDFIPAKSS